MEALEIGGAHAQTETTDDDHGHDHRRKRSTDLAFMLNRASWVNNFKIQYSIACQSSNIIRGTH